MHFWDKLSFIIHTKFRLKIENVEQKSAGLRT